MRLPDEDQAIITEMMTRHEASSMLDGIITALVERLSLEMRSNKPHLYAGYSRLLEVLGDAQTKVAAIEGQDEP